MPARFARIGNDERSNGGQFLYSAINSRQTKRRAPRR